MANPALRQRLGEAGRQYVLAYGMTCHGMIATHTTLYER
jgi:hypothetical protein